MRILRFIVTGQKLIKDPACDFSRIVKGTSGYLHCQFATDSDWNGCGKLAIFNDQIPAKVDANGMCEIPAKALTGDMVSIRLTGVKNNFRIRTNKSSFMQER